MTPILIAVGGTLVYMGLLFLVSTLGRKAERVSAGDRRESPEEAGAANDGEEEKKHRDDDVPDGRPG